MAYTARKHVHKGKSRHAFKKRAGMTHRKNADMPLRGGIRL